MTPPPVFSIDPALFHRDPYPVYREMRARAPIAFVPELQAILITKRDAIARHEKNTAVFSSEQPDGLMTKLMGVNMMRRDGEAHLVERKAVFPSVSPRTARDIWLSPIADAALALLDGIAPKGEADLFTAFAAPLAGETLKLVTGLTHVGADDIDRWSQAMIDGIANYAGVPEIEATCRAAVSEITEAVRQAPPSAHPNLINTQRDAGLSEEQIAANIRLAISGGQNETRDAICGLIWALLKHPEALDQISQGAASFADAFDEYVRFIAPIGMSPRRVAKDAEIDGLTFQRDARVFLMFASANRDEDVFANPDAFDLSQDASRHIAFGAGPHFCAGAPLAKTVVAQVAAPRVFEKLADLALAEEPEFAGWAFRGPLSLRCRW